jgi:hypothetical protein
MLCNSFCVSNVSGTKYKMRQQTCIGPYSANASRSNLYNTTRPAKGPEIRRVSEIASGPALQNFLPFSNFSTNWRNVSD